MKKRLYTSLLALCLMLSLLPGTVLAEDGGPVSSSNKNRQDYSTWSSTVKSYLYENQSGGLTRVEYINGQVIIEDYDSGYQYQSGRTIEAELPLWGGFYAGAEYNFLIYGQNNNEESDSTEVIRVVKYDKEWNRLDQVSLNGANTVGPFEAGSLRCDEYGGYLYIRTCHKMYTSNDGLNHQSNLTMAVRQSDMSITDSYYEVMNQSYGYVSHSFNQFIIVDEDGKIVTLDHGDAYPRGIVFMKYYADAGTGKFTGSGYGDWCSAGTMKEFAGAIGQNATGASAGGLAETTDCYIMAYNYDGQGGSGPRLPYYHYMDKASGESWSVEINYPGSTTPVLAPTGLDGGYMMWNGKDGYSANDTLYYLQYGADGKPGETRTAAGSLSDCQPIYYNGKVVWYVTDNSVPVFYGLDNSGVTVLGRADTENPPETAAPSPEPETPAAPSTPETPAVPETPETPPAPSRPETPSTPEPAGKPNTAETPDRPSTPNRPSTPGTPNSQSEVSFSDVMPNVWYYQAVQYVQENGLMSGVGGNRFDPGSNLSRAQLAQILYNASDKQAAGSNGFQDIPRGAWYADAVSWAAQAGVVSGFGDNRFGPGENITREQLAVMLWRYAGEPAPKSASLNFTDANRVRNYAVNAMCWAVENGIINGYGGGRLEPDGLATRAQTASMLMRYMEL